MLYLTWICVFLLFSILLCFVLIMRKRLSRQMLLGICIASFAISVFFPMRWVLCNPILKEQVAITTLKDKNDASLAWDVIINYFDTNYSERRIENPVEGKWAWWDGAYVWFDAWESMGVEPTDTVVFEIPVGDQRSIVFTSGPRCGKAKIACMGISQQVDLYSKENATFSVQLPPSEEGLFEKDMWLRVVAFFAMVVLITSVMSMTAVFINRKTNWRILLKWKYEAFVFLLSLMNIIIMGLYPNIDGYSNAYYFIPYERGFGSRGLIGELALLFGGPYISQEEQTSFILFALILFYLFCSILIVRLAKKQTDWHMGLFWVLLYLLTPLFFIDIFDDLKPDFLLVIIFILGVVLINYNRFLQIIPGLCVVMILFNETSCVFFVAPLLALLLYFAVTKRIAGYIISFFSSLAFTCITTLRMFLLLDTSGLVPIDSFFAHMGTHTNVPLDYNAFRAEYKTFNSVFTDMIKWMGNQVFIEHELVLTVILYFILIIPFVILISMLWKAVYKKLMIRYKDGKNNLLVIKFLYLILVLSSCGGLLCMLLAWDHLRFTKFIVIAAIAIMFTLIDSEDLTLHLCDLYLFTPPRREFPIAPFAILIYMKFWGAMDTWGFNTQLLIDSARLLIDFLGIR